MSDFEVDMSSLTRSMYTRRSPFLGTLCLYPRTCDTCLEYQRLRTSTYQDSELPNDLRRITRIFVNAIDLEERGLGYPVHIFMLPKVVFRDILYEFTYMHTDDPEFNIIHPEHGNNIIIERTGMGIQTRYNARIDHISSKIPNTNLYDQLIAGDKSSLYHLETIIARFFDAQGQLQQRSPIVKLEGDLSSIRILPPYSDAKLIHAEYGFHYLTVEQLRQRREQEASAGLYNSTAATTTRTQATRRTTMASVPIRGRTLMLPEEEPDEESDMDDGTQTISFLDEE